MRLARDFEMVLDGRSTSFIYEERPVALATLRMVLDESAPRWRSIYRMAAMAPMFEWMVPADFIVCVPM